MYEDITFEDILDRMLDRVPDSFDKREGSVIYDALAPAAVELQLMYIELDIILGLTFADTAEGEYLDRRCAERGITRNSSTNAILKGVFTPTSIQLDIGTEFSLDDLNYTITKKIADGQYQLTCETAGIIGNTMFGQLIPVDYIEGLETAELTEVLIPGEDEESDDDLRTRYFESFDTKPYGGNIKDYIEKTNAIEGVGLTKVTPTWNGGGTVLLTITDSNYGKPSDTLVNKVQTEIDPNSGDGSGIAPIGHIVTVQGVIERRITISATVTYDEGFSFATLKETITQSMEEYLLSLRKQWASQTNSVVRISQVETRLLGINGILDVSNTRINNSTSNLTCDKYEIPVLGGVTA